jgi:queuine tRNA-ribosyltransferase
MSIPIIYGLKSGCLTNRDWQVLGVTTGAVSLDALLMKPGIDTLKKIDNLNTWLGWHGKIYLLQEYSGTIKDFIYSLKSSYDGAKITVSLDELNKIILQLRVDEIINSNDKSYNVSDNAEQLAMAGKFIVDKTPHNILDETYENDLNLLVAGCNCPSCAQGFTRAYLQHLYKQTPLLAHRYLAMHNFFLI